MMVNKLFFCLSIMLGGYFSASSQKPSVEKEMDGKWPEVSFGGISNDGRYLIYAISNGSSDSMIVLSTISNKQIVISGINNAHLTQDNKHVIFKRNDSLCILDLMEPSAIRYLTNISQYQSVNYGRHDDLLLYRLRNEPDRLFIKEFESGRELSYSAVVDYWLNDAGNLMFFETTRVDTGDTSFELNLLNISSGRSQKIWRGAKVSELLIDNDECVFTVARTSDSALNSIWSFRDGDQSALKVIDDHSTGIQNGLSIESINSFKSAENRIYFYLTESNKKKMRVGSLDVWSYKDAKLQSEQLNDLLHSSRNTISYNAVVNISDGKVIQLEYKDERLLSELSLYREAKFALVRKSGSGDGDEWNWNKDSRSSVYLVSLNNGSRKLIGKGINPWLANEYVLSYNQNYIYYYDAASRNYCAYSITDTNRINMTAAVNGNWTVVERDDEPASSVYIYPIGGLIKNTDALIVYDRNNIFELDPTAKKHAIRLTGGQSPNNDLVFRLTPQNKLQ